MPPDQPSTGYEARKAGQRARRRDSERRAHPLSAKVLDGRVMDILSLRDPGDDPPEVLEELRGALLKALIIDASETQDRELRAKICINLLKFSSMGRTNVDLTHGLKRDDLPDLSRVFSADDLAMLVSATDESLLRMVSSKASGPALPESASDDGDAGHAGDGTA